MRHTPEQTWPAPAKLNLFLHVTGRLTSGYHRLQTLFQLLDWGDEIAIRATREPTIRRVIDIPGVSEQDDLSLKAARLLQAEAGCSQGAVIGIRKHIPMGAGLGGGSSDAATVLHVLNKLWSCRLPAAQLAQLGLQLGADVPVFLAGRSAWAEGVGEHLQPVSLGSSWYVLLMPGIQIPTAEIFADPDLPRDTAPIDRANYQFESSRNDCQELAVRRYPELARIIEDVSEFGSWRMTGTGSAIFSRARNQNHGDTVTRGLKCRYNVCAVSGVDRSSLFEAGVPE